MLSLLRFLRRARTTTEIRKLYSSMAWLYEFDDAITLFTKKVIRRTILEEARLQDGQQILEIASGTGEMTRLISRPLSKGNLVCLDLSIGTLIRGKRKIEREGLSERVDFVIGNGEQTPFRDGLFDTVICCYALDTVEHPELVVREIYRLLRDGGRFSVGFKGSAKGILSTVDKLVWEPYLRLVWNCGAVDIDRSFSDAGFSNLKVKERFWGYYRIISGQSQHTFKDQPSVKNALGRFLAC